MSAFGLIAVNQRTMQRTLRPSAFLYHDIIEDNGLTLRVLQKHKDNIQ